MSETTRDDQTVYLPLAWTTSIVGAGTAVIEAQYILAALFAGTAILVGLHAVAAGYHKNGEDR